ncbi:tetratricopeptide repeat protein [Treponema lecithinolyticum]|jgi:Tetratricopeptide repeat.|uniref:Tetratricopeptide repeat protein n=2 Tax=Treponema lecithinolyticum TaxID=53418 RepID=A0ABN0P1N4_TRELE|nr:tetratricopeptide repeat protein [Treponema lecithinolyticum]ERJ94396.1 tetratricopeptide repeat protein [Treponema lecithinolyticum ATCC 700332]
MTENPDVLNTQAIDLAAKGDYDEAIACFKRAIYMENSNHLLWYNLGITYRDSGNLNAAKQALLTAYALDDTDQELLESLTLVCFALDETDDAFEYCSESLELNGENARSWNNLGVLYFSRSEYQKAEEAFEQALSIYPHYYDALYNLRDTYAELGNKTGEAECTRLLSDMRSSGSVMHA